MNVGREGLSHRAADGALVLLLLWLVPLEPAQGDWLLFEMLERVIEKGVAFDAFVVGEGGIDMGRVRLVLPPNDDDDGGDDDGAASQMRSVRHRRLIVVGPAVQRRDRS